MIEGPLLEEIVSLLALRKLDLIGPSEVVRWAEEQARNGVVEFDALIDLAAEPISECAEVDVALRSLAHDLDYDRMTEMQAGEIAVRSVARCMERGIISPIEAARRIWRIVLRVPACEPEFRTFIGLASEWDDDFAHRNDIEDEIRVRACELLI